MINNDIRKWARLFRESAINESDDNMYTEAGRFISELNEADDPDFVPRFEIQSMCEYEGTIPEVEYVYDTVGRGDPQDEDEVTIHDLEITINPGDIYDEFGVEMWAVVREIKVESGNVIFILDDADLEIVKEDHAGEHNPSSRAFTSGKILEALSKAEPDAKMFAALASEPSKKIPVQMQTINDGMFAVFADDWGKAKHSKAFMLDDTLFEQLGDAVGWERLEEPFIDKYLDNKRAEAEYDAWSDYDPNERYM